MTAQPKIDTCAIAISRPPDGVETRANTIDQFERNFISKSKINVDSYICAEYPAYDCAGCHVIPLCDQHDLTKVVGYLILGTAKEWDTTCDPHKVKNSVKVRFPIGEVGVMAFNTDKNYLNYAAVTNQFNLAMKIAEAGEVVICANSLDDAYQNLHTGLPESIVPIVVGFKQSPEHFQDHYIQFNETDYLKLNQQDIKIMMFEKRNEYIKYLESIDAEKCREKPKEWQEPEPLKLKSEYIEGEYPIHAFPEIAQRAIEKSSFYNHVPLALAGQFALGVMTYIAQEHAQAPSDKSQQGQPCSLALFSIFESGGGKDETSKLLGKSILDLENTAMQKYKDEVRAYKALDKGERAATPYPINTTTMFDKGTLQGLVKFMSNSPMGSFIWQVTEGAKVLGGYSLTSETVGESLGVINTLIDQGKTSTILRGAEEPEIVIGKRFSLDLSIQEVMARKVLNNEIFRLQGFLARFLFAAPEPLPLRIVTKHDRQIKADEDADIIAFNVFCERLKNPPQKESVLLEPDRILFHKSNEADDIHIQYENYINQQCENGGKYFFIRPNARRTIQYCLRVATVLAYFTPELDVIDAKTMQAATDLCKYSLDEWIRYYAAGEESDSQLLLAFLVKQKQQQIKKSYIRQNAPSKLRNSKRLGDALEHLADSGYIMISESKPISIILNPNC